LSAANGHTRKQARGVPETGGLDEGTKAEFATEQCLNTAVAGLGSSSGNRLD
jgi:hypothetical protein